MTFSATVIEDTRSSAGVRLTTLQLRYPRFIHAEFMTHRMFSRNASSSRAIPVSKLIEDVKRDPAMPVFWGKNQPGMQAREEHNELINVWPDLRSNMTREETWLYARDEMIQVAEAFARAGYHKQIVNRLLEPWAHINVVVTATEWDNFFKLRLHPDAQPEIYELANVMKASLDELARVMQSAISTSQATTPSTTHLPYVLDDERETYSYNICGMLSAARCARVSYMTHEGKAPDFQKDLDLAKKLLESEHMSPFEHAAQAIASSSWNANFRGWSSYRSLIEAPIQLDLSELHHAS